MRDTRRLLIATLGAVLVGCQDSPPRFAGNELYAGNCSSCHGVYGDGEGSAAIAQTVPDLRQLAARNDGVFPRELVRKIIDGREILPAHSSDVMPKWGQEFQRSEGFSDAADARVDAKIEARVDFVAGIQTTD